MVGGKKPTHKGNVTIKEGDNWRKLGDCTIWADNADGSVSGTFTVEGVTYSFRGWKQ